MPAATDGASGIQVLWQCGSTVGTAVVQTLRLRTVSDAGSFQFKLAKSTLKVTAEE